MGCLFKMGIVCFYSFQSFSVAVRSVRFVAMPLLLGCIHCRAMSDQRRSSLSCLCSEHFLSTQFRLASDRFSPVRFNAFPCFYYSSP